MTLTVAAGLSSVSHAQQSTAALTGEWVGNIESPGKSEFARLSLTENAGEFRRPLKAKLSLVKRFPPGFFETMVDWTTTQLRRRAPGRR